VLLTSSSRACADDLHTRDKEREEAVQLNKAKGQSGAAFAHTLHAWRNCRGGEGIAVAPFWGPLTTKRTFPKSTGTGDLDRASDCGCIPTTPTLFVSTAKPECLQHPTHRIASHTSLCPAQNLKTEKDKPKHNLQKAQIQTPTAPHAHDRWPYSGIVNAPDEPCSAGGEY
jgi:hypothetical protein